MAWSNPGASPSWGFLETNTGLSLGETPPPPKVYLHIDVATSVFAGDVRTLMSGVFNTGITELNGDIVVSGGGGSPRPTTGLLYPRGY